MKEPPNKYRIESHLVQPISLYMLEGIQSVYHVDVETSITTYAFINQVTGCSTLTSKKLSTAGRKQRPSKIRAYNIRKNKNLRTSWKNFKKVLPKLTLNLNQELYYQNLLETKLITTKYIALAHIFQKITNQSLSIQIQNRTNRTTNSSFHTT